MPVFQDWESSRLQQQPPPAWPLNPPNPPPAMHRTSEESIRTEFCEGPLLDNVNDDNVTTDMTSSPSASNDGLQEYPRLPVRDRAELIERIKRAQNPARWTESVKERPSSPVIADEPLPTTPPTGPQASLLPAIKLKGPISPEEAARCEEARAASLQAGREIQRPRSALHAGDFTEVSNPSDFQPQTPPISNPFAEISLRSSTQSPSSPSIDISRPRRPSFPSPQAPTASRYSFDYTPSPVRPRAPSLHSYSSSFVYKVPTSPLVQHESNDDLDNGTQTPQNSKDGRRRTLPPDTFHNFRSVPNTLAQAARQPGAFHMDVSFSSQNRHARRSSTFDRSFLPSISPPTSGFLRSRGASFSGESSPLQPSSMVGSYEESILRGRMSTTPSKPVEFTAQIGALGKGDCKPKFPDHVTLSFPAVYYNWSSAEAADLPSMAEPSPYVGQIDLENGLPPPKRRERRSEQHEATASLDPSRDVERSSEHCRRRKRSISPSKRPFGGSYRIPQQGQLQILIKNPNKTAVKLFLIPYDLEGMEVGTKTFIRQNAYSAGPIIEGLRSPSACSDAVPEAKSGLRTPRPTLRYSIHLHVCCPSKGRFYLYKSIKVVFANRVPDNKEKLRNEIRLPEPRFSPYRPNDVPSSPSISSARRSLEKEYRRRSSFQMSEESFEGSPRPVFHQRFPSSSYVVGLSSPPPMPPLPPSFASGRPHGLGILGSVDPNSAGPRVPTSQQKTEQRAEASSALISPLEAPEQTLAISPPNEAQDEDHDKKDLNTVTSPSPSLSPFGTGAITDLASSTYSTVSTSSNASTDSAYSKLSRGDVGYGGLFARPGTPEASEGLLSRRLRGLEVQGEKEKEKDKER